MSLIAEVIIFLYHNIKFYFILLYIGVGGAIIIDSCNIIISDYKSL
jgi:hypothetical protein